MFEVLNRDSCFTRSLHGLLCRHVYVKKELAGLEQGKQKQRESVQARSYLGCTRHCCCDGISIGCVELVRVEGTHVESSGSLLDCVDQAAG